MIMPVVSTIKMKAQRFLQLGEDPPGVRLELVDGEVAVSPSPMPRYAFVVMKLAKILGNYVDDNDLGELFQDVDTLEYFWQRYFLSSIRATLRDTFWGVSSSETLKLDQNLHGAEHLGAQPRTSFETARSNAICWCSQTNLMWRPKPEALLVWWRCPRVFRWRLCWRRNEPEIAVGSDHAFSQPPGFAGAERRNAAGKLILLKADSISFQRVCVGGYIRR